jgi:hypothetical protein
MPIPYSILDALIGGNVNHAEPWEVMNVGNFTADDCCQQCMTNCIGFAVTDFRSYSIAFQPTPESFLTPTAGCIDGVYPVGAPLNPEPVVAEQWYLGPCVAFVG